MAEIDVSPIYQNITVAVTLDGGNVEVVAYPVINRVDVSVVNSDLALIKSAVSSDALNTIVVGTDGKLYVAPGNVNVNQFFQTLYRFSELDTEEKRLEARTNLGLATIDGGEFLTATP